MFHKKNNPSNAPALFTNSLPLTERLIAPTPQRVTTTAKPVESKPFLSNELKRLLSGDEKLWSEWGTSFGIFKSIFMTALEKLENQDEKYYQKRINTTHLDEQMALTQKRIKLYGETLQWLDKMINICKREKDKLTQYAKQIDDKNDTANGLSDVSLKLKTKAKEFENDEILNKELRDQTNKKLSRLKAHLSYLAEEGSRSSAAKSPATAKADTSDEDKENKPPQLSQTPAPSHHTGLPFAPINAVPIPNTPASSSPLRPLASPT